MEKTSELVKRKHGEVTGSYGDELDPDQADAAAEVIGPYGDGLDPDQADAAAYTASQQTDLTCYTPDASVQESQSVFYGDQTSPRANVAACRVKVGDFFYIDPNDVKTNYEIIIPKEEIPRIIQKAQQLSPLLIDTPDDPVYKKMIDRETSSPRKYTWLLIAELDSNGAPYSILLVSEVKSRQEIGTAHLDMYNSYKERNAGKAPYRVYLAGELKVENIDGDNHLTFNFLSGTFMLQKTMANPINVANNFINLYLETSFPEFVIAFDSSNKTFINPNRGITLEEMQHLQNLFEGTDTEFLRVKPSKNTKPNRPISRGGTKTKKNKTKKSKTKKRKTRTKK